MSFHFADLDDEIRKLMLEEIEADAAAGAVYYSKRFAPNAETLYEKLLREAAENGTEVSLADALRAGACFVLEERARKPSGGTTVKKVPHTAPETFSEGEFNRYYMRALCRAVKSAGGTSVEVYRAKAVDNARSASAARIGALIDVDALLADLRSHKGVDTCLGLPPGPNSGLSVRRKR